MPFELSFSDSFYCDGDPYSIDTSKRPTSVFQAIISLPEETKLAIARDVFGDDEPETLIVTEMFPFEVMDKIRETNTCTDLTPPVRVWIDPKGNYSVDVYDEE